MLLSNDKILFEQLIKDIVQNMDISPIYIEKDFYAITVLKELISRNQNFVFKGGTSLSVCQHAVNRFSEDIDISYLEERITVGTRKAIKKAFFDSIEAASLILTNPDNIRSRRIFNRYICNYESFYGDKKGTVIVEWATQTPAFPIEDKTAQTIIGKYLESINRFDLVEKYNLESFIVKTMTKERTLVDKIFAICDYHISKKVDRESRHIYDIHQLLNLVKLDDNFIDLFLKVREYRKKLEKCYSSGEENIISKLLIELIERGTFKQDYNLRTYPLLYDHIRYEDCIPSIRQIAAFLENHNL